MLVFIYLFIYFCPGKEFLPFPKCVVPKPWRKPLCLLRLFVTTTVTVVTDSLALLSVCSHYFNLLTTWTVVWKTAEVSTSGAVNLNPPPSYSFVSYCPPFPLPLPLRWTTYASTECLKNCNVKHEKHEDLCKEWSRTKQEILIFIPILGFFLNLVVMGYYRRFGWEKMIIVWSGPVSSGSVHSSWIAWPFTMGPIGCPETSVTNWINQPDAATSQVYYLSFKYSSTCFGHPHAYHQELQQLQ